MYFYTLSPTDLERYSPSKIFRKDGSKTSYKAGPEFIPHRNNYTLETFHDVMDLVLQSKTEFMILGELNEFGLNQLGDQYPDDCQPCVRPIARRKKEKDDGVPIAIEFDNDANIMVLDLDDHIIKKWRPNNPDVQLKQWCLDRDINCDITFQITSSQKLETDNIRVRLYFLLDKDYSLDHRKAYGISEEIEADGSVFSSVQPIYTAPPTFEEGEDFIPVRHGFLRGKTRTHRLPTWEEKEVKERALRHATRYSDYDFDTGVMPPEVLDGSIYRQFFMPYAFRLANKGLKRAEIIEFIEVKTLQIQTRLFDLENVEQYTDDALSRLEFEKKNKSKDSIDGESIIDDIDIGDDEYTTHQWPTGHIGKFASEISDWMTWRNTEIGIITARCDTAALMGRRFSFEGLNLNQNNVMLGAQAIGKDTPSKVMNMIIDELIAKASLAESSISDGLLIGKLSAYRPKQKPKGVTALHRSMSKSPSCLVLISEAGASSRSISGDMASVSAYTLQNYTTAAHSVFSVDDLTNALPDVWGTNFIRLEEAETNSYAHNFTQDMATGGEFARKNHFFIDHRPQMEEIVKRSKRPFSQETIDNLEKLILFGMEGEDFNASAEVGKVVWNGPCLMPLKREQRINLEFTPEADRQNITDMNAELKLRKNTKDPGTLSWAVMGRFLEKSKREAAFLAAVQYVLDPILDDENAPQPIVTLDHYEEAKRFIEECDRAAQANYNRFGITIGDLVDETYLTIKGLKGSKEYKRSHPSKTLWEKNAYKHSFIFRGTRKIMGMVKKSAETRNRETSDIIKMIYEDGEKKGFWKVLDKRTPFEIWVQEFGTDLPVRTTSTVLIVYKKK